MAIVKEYKNEYGAIIQIDDSAYRDKTPEELEKVRENIYITANRILYAYAKRKRNEEL